MADEKIDMDRIEALAKAATPGPYEADPLGTVGSVDLASGFPLAQCFQLQAGSGKVVAADNEQRRHNARFFAARDPATVLALVARARRADEQEQEIGEAGVEFQDERVRYVALQIPRSLWLECKEKTT